MLPHIVFHDIDPDCAKALSVEECIEYGPWGRDYKTRQNNLANGVVVKPDFVYFETGWFEGMIHRLYFAIKTHLRERWRAAHPNPAGLHHCCDRLDSHYFLE